MKYNKISTLEMSIIDVNSEYLGVNRRLLMENSGKGIADLALEIYKKNNRSNITIFAGKGGNGGDGMVAARHLSRSVPVYFYLLGSSKEILKRSTVQNWQILQNMTDSIAIEEINQLQQIEKLEVDSKALIIDALLGTGIKGNIREPLLTLLKKINIWQETGAIVLSVDIPTGIDPNTGLKSNIFIKPEWTGVLHKKKHGISSEIAGKIKLLPIGIPLEAETIIGPGDILSLKKRDHWAKKGDSGKVLVIGGNEIYSGAPILAAMGSVQSGVDLVSVLTPLKISSSLRSFSPELIIHDYSEPHLTPDSVSVELIDQNDAILLGPGLGRHIDTKQAVDKILEIVKEFNKPIVIDADALKLIELKKITSKTILTPHAGEFEILTKLQLPNGRNNFKERLHKIKEISSKYPNIWVVKGHWDIVSDKTQTKINKTGTPQMTRGGTGDVLAGLITGFVVQTEFIFYASCLGTYINGRAGELAGTNFSLKRLLENIPIALKETYDFIKKD